MHSDVKIDNDDMNVKWNEFYPWKTYKGFSFIINEYWMYHVLIFIDCIPPPFYWISSIVPLPNFIDFRRFYPSPFYWFLSPILLIFVDCIPPHFIDFCRLNPSPLYWILSPILLIFVDCIPSQFYWISSIVPIPHIPYCWICLSVHFFVKMQWLRNLEWN